MTSMPQQKIDASTFKSAYAAVHQTRPNTLPRTEVQAGVARKLRVTPGVFTTDMIRWGTVGLVIALVGIVANLVCNIGMAKEGFERNKLIHLNDQANRTENAARMLLTKLNSDSFQNAQGNILHMARSKNSTTITAADRALKSISKD